VFTGVAPVEGATFIWLTSLNQFATLNSYVWAGQGGIGLSAATPIADLSVNWEAVPFDAEDIPANGTTHDLPNNALQFQSAGIWNITVFVNLAHNESNGGREIDVRFYNLTDSAAGQEFTFPVARNQPGTAISFSALTNISASEIDKSWQLQVSGGTDSFSSVIARNAHFHVSRVGVLV
jgi:hypothetical protein